MSDMVANSQTMIDMGSIFSRSDIQRLVTGLSSAEDQLSAAVARAEAAEAVIARALAVKVRFQGVKGALVVAEDIRDILAAAPQTVLAERIAQAKAEALEEAAEATATRYTIDQKNHRHPQEGPVLPRAVVTWLRDRAAAIREAVQS